jgi:alcohol dehydrogenase
MDTPIEAFRFDYSAGDIRYGQDCVADLSSVLSDRGWENAMLVCGQTVGSTDAVMDPVRSGLGDRLETVFDETRPSKYVGIAAEGSKIAAERNVDVLVAVGGGSSLDLGKAISVIDALDLEYDEIVERIRSDGTLPMPDAHREVLPNVVIPTTLAGADLTINASVTATPDRSGVPDEGYGAAAFADQRLMPEVLFYDPALFATTPDDILTTSAMNGFDKGIEVPYSRNATPITDAAAIRGLRYLDAGLPDLAGATAVDEALEKSIIGLILVQYGFSTPRRSENKLSIIHGFGHGFTRHFDVQQGTVHGIAAPIALRYIFDRVDGSRNLIAEGLGIDPTDRSDEQTGGQIIERVEGIRDALGLPGRVRDLPGVSKSDLPRVAKAISSDWGMECGPAGLEPTAEEIEALLRDAW